MVVLRSDNNHEIFSRPDFLNVQTCNQVICRITLTNAEPDFTLLQFNLGITKSVKFAIYFVTLKYGI